MALVRQVVARLAPAALLALALACGPAWGQGAPAPADPAAAPAPLPDIARGSPGAAVTIVEYASLTCSHCAAFHQRVWPELKAKYVDSGKVRFILREFPFDPLAAAGFLLGRCLGPDKRDAFLDTLFDDQEKWAFVDNPVEPLAALAEKAGMPRAAFNACLTDQRLYDQLKATRAEAARRFAVDSTPTFLVGGQKLVGEVSLADFDKALAPLLK
jgi:protein-disulfide isomerase